jgi:hypothetical protein
MKKPRFLIIAWPEDHEEDLADHACAIQDAIDTDMGCPRVLMPLPEILERAIEESMRATLKDL